MIIVGEDRSLLLPNSFLVGYGCKNCVWKDYGQCPKGFTKEGESTDEGYCQEIVDFFNSLHDGGGRGSLSAVKEKFHLYVQELQALADKRKYHRLQGEYDLRRAEGWDYKELAKLRMELESYKIWWARLSESVVKGLGRVADRESRKQEGKKQIMNVQQLNVLMKESADRLKLEVKGD